MTNAELIKALRYCGAKMDCRDCPLRNKPSDACFQIMIDAADALEAADKRIAELEKSYSWKAYAALEESIEGYKTRIAELEDDLRNSTISNIERFKVYDYKVKDLILFADMCKRNDVREADLKQAAWNLGLAVRAVMNERAEIVKNTMDEIAMRFTPDFAKAYAEMMRKEQTDETD